MSCDEKVVFSCDGTELVSLEANVEEHGDPVGGSMVCKDISGTVRIRLDAASQQFGGTTVLIRDGGIQMASAQGKPRVVITGGDPWENQDGGIIELTTDSPAMTSEGPSAAIVLNASERALAISAPDGTKILRLSALDQNAVEVRDSKGRRILALNHGNANLYLGAKGNEGDLVLIDGGGVERIHLNAAKGQVFLRDSSGGDRVQFDGATGSVIVRGPDGADRIDLLGLLDEIVVKGLDQQTVLRFSGLDGTLSIGGVNQAGSIAMFNAAGSETLNVDGEKGDIHLRNADCAEEFELAPGLEVGPATVMVMDERGLLTPSFRPYDRAVVGVVSGGDGKRPGIVLGHRPGEGTRLPIALAGRVQCRVDADFASIEVGDLLTTSGTPGHAMKAIDPDRAFGAVLGKALSPLPSGRGAVAVLAAMQ
jgi:hypothetical protein